MKTVRIPIAALAGAVVCMMAGPSWAQAPGDYHHDGVLDDLDLDLQAIAIQGGHHPPEFDLTKDGWVNFEDRLAWVADLKNTWMGDVNLDLYFDSSDLVQVFAAGSYETGHAASWVSGDWDGNAVFDSSDMVVAFDGGYECGRRLVGDYNRNRQLDAGDLDLQAIEMVRGRHPAPYDLNHDGLVNFDDRQVWVCDLKKTWMGDANLDGVFDSSDMVQVFAGGKYEIAEPAGWAEGDWNGSRFFDSSDMVAAWRSCWGGPTEIWCPVGQIPAAVPEPGGALLVALGVACLITVRRRA